MRDYFCITANTHITAHHNSTADKHITAGKQRTCPEGVITIMERHPLREPAMLPLAGRAPQPATHRG